MVFGLFTLSFLALAGVGAGILLALESERLGWKPCYRLRKRDQEARSAALAAGAVALVAALAFGWYAADLFWLAISGSGLFGLAMMAVALLLVEPRHGGDGEGLRPLSWPEFDNERELWSRDHKHKRPLDRV